MTRKRPRHEYPQDTADADRGDESGKEPIERFKELTRNLLSVSNAQLQDELRREEVTKANRKRRRK